MTVPPPRASGPAPRQTGGQRTQRTKTKLPFGATAALAALVGFGLAFGTVAWLVFPSDTAIREVRVPSVTGLPFADAERRLSAVGLLAGRGVERASADVPRNAVASQTPVGGQTANSGSVVVLDISTGQPQSVVPSIVGLSRDDAAQLLQRAGLVLGQVSEQPSDSASRGIILVVSPSAGSTVPAGTQVSLIVSAGATDLSLPDMVGGDLDLARSTIDQLGLSTRIEYDSLSSLPPGTVVAQSPGAGAMLTRGSTVTLRVSARQ